MLLVWGSGGGRAILGELPEEQCEACGAKTKSIAFVDYKYWHLWYLLSFLVGREYSKSCTGCGAVVHFDKAEARFHFPKDNIPFIRKRGWLIIVGLILFVVLLGAIGSWRTRAAVSAMIAQPNVMDLYYADLSKVENSGYRQGGPSLYGIMALVDERDDGTYLFATSTIAYDKKTQLEKELKNGPLECTNDEDNPVILSREELDALFRAKVIYDGKRPTLSPPASE